MIYYLILTSTIPASFFVSVASLAVSMCDVSQPFPKCFPSVVGFIKIKSLNCTSSASSSLGFGSNFVFLYSAFTTAIMICHKINIWLGAGPWGDIADVLGVYLDGITWKDMPGCNTK